jgi:Tol biopolymer transport system component
LWVLTVSISCGPDGSGLRRITGSGLLTEPDWSPDGRRFVAEGPGESIVTLAIGGGRRQQVARRGYEPAWSPDGRWIAFQRDGALWAVRPDGSRLRRLADEEGVASEGGHAAWSPDSRQIVFEVIHDRGRFVRRAMSLSVVPAVGGEIARLTYGGSAWDDPAWRDGVIGKSTF